MGLIYKTEKRRIIPKWRSIEIATANGELNVSSNRLSNIKFELELLSVQKQAYSKSRDLAHAGDLLSSAYVLGLEKEFKEVANFIIQKESNENNSLVKLANNVLGLNKSEFTLEQNIDEAVATEIKHTFNINRYRSYLNKEPKNPIAWIELARLYSLIGKKQKAKRCITAALFLDKDNRFIVRSASRFYHHYESDNNAALATIKKSAFIKSDPWLISAEVAYSSLIERASTMAKIGIDFIKNKDHSNFETTELASALGTLEYSNGKVKEARKYFNTSLINPNDNSLAQVRWMSESVQGIDFDVDKYNIPLAFEAMTIANLEDEKYSKSLENSLKWMSDEPYSTRPVKVASYISSIFLDDNEKAILILREGLHANPDDIMLNNNLVYFLVRGDMINEAIKVFNSKLLGKLNDSDSISKLTMTATAGLLLYRDGRREDGQKFYQRSIELAKLTNNEYLVALATVNYAKEELRFTKDKNSILPLINYLQKYFKIYDSPDVKIFYDELLKDCDNIINK